MKTLLTFKKDFLSLEKQEKMEITLFVICGLILFTVLTSVITDSFKIGGQL